MYSDPRIGAPSDKIIDDRDGKPIELDTDVGCLRPLDFAVDRIHWSPIAALKWSLVRPWRGAENDEQDASEPFESLVMRALALPGRHRLNAPDGEPARVLSGRALMAGLLLVGFDVVLNATRGQAYPGTAPESADPGEVETAEAKIVEFGGAPAALEPFIGIEQGHDSKDALPVCIDHGFVAVEQVQATYEPAVALVRQSQSTLVPLEVERRAESAIAPATGREPDLLTRPQLLVGTDGNDVLIGGAGDDVLVGGAGNDVLIGGAGNDQLLGGDGDDQLAGDTGDDELIGEAGDDDLVGGEGNDELDGGAGADTMAGGAGDDTFVVDDAYDSVIEIAGAGHDTILTTLNVLVLADAVEVLKYVGEASFTGFGNAGDNEIYGADGDDELFGEDESGGSTAEGADGSSVDAASIAVSAEATPGALEVREIDPATAALVEILGDTQEAIVFLDIQAAPTETSDQTVSSSQIEVETVVIGSKSNDTIVGLHGSNDTIFGGKGNDRITGGAGDDILSGGDGRDTFIFRAGFGNDVITDFSTANEDRDIIVFGSGMFVDEADLDAHMTQVGSDVVISVSSSDQIVLSNVDKLTLSIHDQFIFA